MTSTYFPPHSVTFAQLRPVMTEDLDAYPSQAYSLVTSLPSFAMRVICTTKLIWQRSDALHWYKPALFEWIDKRLGWLKIYPECSFISYFPEPAHSKNRWNPAL